MSDLVSFVIESNMIERIIRPPTEEELDAHRAFLILPTVEVRDLEQFVSIVCGAKLRDQPQLNVTVGGNPTPPGGPQIRAGVASLLRAGLGVWRTHVEYVLLHPFMDGNGRSGRVLWAWMMRQCGLDPFKRDFLHEFYYQSFDAARGVQPWRREEGNE